MNGRIADSLTGRFLSPDPYIPYAGSTQSFNRYSYVRNNPLSATDPSGFIDWWDWDFYFDFCLGWCYDPFGGSFGDGSKRRPRGSGARQQNKAPKIKSSPECGTGAAVGNCYGKSTNNRSYDVMSDVVGDQPIVVVSQTIVPLSPNADGSKGWLESIWDNVYFETGPAVGAHAKVDLIVVSGSIGTPSLSGTYRVTGDGDEGRYTVEGWSAGLRLGKFSFGRPAPDRIIERFDSDNPEGRFYSEEVAKGGFIRSDDGTYRADSSGRLGVGVTVLFWRIRIGLDVHKTIFEATQ